MRAVPGLLVKDGAESVYVAALPDGRACAVKDFRRWVPRPAHGGCFVALALRDAPGRTDPR